MDAPVPRIFEDLTDIPAVEWDALAGTDPFLSRAYLHALQQSGCATPPQGWHAQFITLRQDERLVAAMPLYLKMNSYGEHVFDFAWAAAYRQHGLRYYPKLVCAIPYTPVAGARLLVAPGLPPSQAEALRAQLLAAALQLAREREASSLHCLFVNETDLRTMQAHGMLPRQDVQFHWRNPGYRDFDDYLAALSRDKRKRIKQERRKVREAGIDVQCVAGDRATPEQWAFFARCYAHTREMHHSPPALNEDFFQRIGMALPHNTLLVIATRGNEPIASALCLHTGDTMYGRSWGALEFHPGLHFEACYYRPIEFCIERGIRTFEGGAQGEHKLARGFLPAVTHSAHWLAHPQFARAVENYLERETAAVGEYRDALEERSPFRKGDGEDAF